MNLDSNLLTNELRKYGRKTSHLAKVYIQRTKDISKIKEQLYFNHRCKENGLIPASLRLKSPLNTQEGIRTVRQTSRKLINLRINDCHKRVNIHEKACKNIERYLDERIPENLLNILKKIAKERRDKIKSETRERLDKKLNALFQNSSRKQNQKLAPGNWVKNISDRLLDTDEVSVLSYGMKHSLAPKQLPTAKILASVEAAISYNQYLSTEAK
jgi:hypothetical protein